MKKSDDIRELEYLASSQWGMFTTAQASGLGVGRTQISRMAAAGSIKQMRRGVWRYTIGEETSHPHAKAAWLACYPKLTAAERLGRRPHDAVIACATAASLHGIGDFHEDPYTFIVRTRRQTTSNDLVFHRWELEERDVEYVDTLPTTTKERTVADLVRERHDPDHVAWTAQAAYFKGADPERLNELLGDLGPSYDKRIVVLTRSDELAAEDEDLIEKMTSDIIASLEGRKREELPEEVESAPMVQLYSSIVRRRLAPILEARAAEIEAARSSRGAVSQQ